MTQPDPSMQANLLKALGALALLAAGFGGVVLTFVGYILKDQGSVI